MSIVQLKRRFSSCARAKKCRSFLELCSERQSILDVGVASEIASPDDQSLNYLLKMLPVRNLSYTGLGIEDLTGMNRLYPAQSFVTYDGVRFPFAERSFDWVFSNAVIEHVGGENEQIQFLNEMLRVGRRVFFTTPCKYFPIESHTNVPLLHWNDAVFFKWVERRYPARKGLSRDQLRLLSRSTLNRLLDQSTADSIEVSVFRVLGLGMTFLVSCSNRRGLPGR